MGMFDELECEYPLPHPERQEDVFQTKSLDCLMHRYRITRDGQLLCFSACGWGEEDENEAGTRPEPERVVYHGDVRFYSSFRLDATHWRLLEYEARFTNGGLEWLRTVEDRVDEHKPVVREPEPDPTLEGLPAATRSRIAGMDYHVVEGDERGRRDWSSMLQSCDPEIRQFGYQWVLLPVSRERHVHLRPVSVINGSSGREVVLLLEDDQASGRRGYVAVCERVTTEFPIVFVATLWHECELADAQTPKEQGDELPWCESGE